MAIEHRITSTDSLRSLAQLYLGDAEQWRTIADYNNLNYPYIVEDDTVRRELTHGHGYAYIRRINSQAARTINRGWTLFTEKDAFSGQEKVFEVMDDVTLGPNVANGFIRIRARSKGVHGNLAASTILQPGAEFAINSILISECYTVDTLTGGQDARMLTIGDYIYIPNETSEIQTSDRLRAIMLVGEEDLALDTEGELYVDGFGDLASVQGMDNIVQALNHRFMTERGELALHPTYGSNIYYLIGQPFSPYWLKLIELDIYETLSYEDRITDVKVLEVQAEGTVVRTTITFTVRDTARQVQENFILNYGTAS